MLLLQNQIEEFENSWALPFRSDSQEGRLLIGGMGLAGRENVRVHALDIRYAIEKLDARGIS